MKTLVLGASGFLGRNVADLLEENFEVVRADRRADEGGHRVDLSDVSSILRELHESQPAYIINCAGVVENSQKADINPILTRNLLDAIMETKISVKCVIVTGSAGEYGVVREEQLPINEGTTLLPTNRYAASKVAETRVAESYAREYGLPVVVARLFNPLGPGMHSRFLISSLLNQLDELKKGERDVIEISRLDSRRDYIDVRDIASGMAALLTHRLAHVVYNIGSGLATSNETILRLLAEYSGVGSGFTVTETSPEPEPLVACQADIARIKLDTNWRPSFALKETIGGIVNDKRSAK